MIFIAVIRRFKNSISTESWVRIGIPDSISLSVAAARHCFCQVCFNREVPDNKAFTASAVLEMVVLTAKVSSWLFVYLVVNRCGLCNSFLVCRFAKSKAVSVHHSPLAQLVALFASVCHVSTAVP